MMKMIAGFVIFLGMAIVVFGGKPTLPGECPDFKPFENLDSAKVSGEWLEHFHGKFGDEDTKEVVENCEKKVLTAKPNGFDVVKTFSDSDGKEHTEKASIAKDEGKQAKYIVTSDDIPKGLTFQVIVLDTDYTNRLVSCTCYSDGIKHGYTVGVYGRGKSLETADADAAKEALKARDNIKAELTPVDQTC